jgi:hypothetical protein
MKPTSTFKLGKQTKTLMALLKFKDQHDRNSFKRSMIDAQLSAAVPQSFKERK